LVGTIIAIYLAHMVKTILSVSTLLVTTVAFSQGFSFNFSEVASTKPFAMQSVNDRGDVFGYLQNSDGSHSGTVFNSATGFQSIALTDQDFAVSKVTTGGYVYSLDSNLRDNGPTYRTSIGGVRTQLDFTNGGAITFGANVHVLVSDDDRVVISDVDSKKTYLWSQATGSKQVGDTSLQVFGFGNNGSLIANGPGNIVRIAADGTQTNIDFPAQVLALGPTKVAYSETPSGSQIFSVLSLENYAGGTYAFFTHDYVVPNNQSSPYLVTRSDFYQGNNRTPGGQTILGINDNGLAVTENYGDHQLTNQPSFGVVDRNGILNLGALILGIDASSQYVIGTASGPGLGTNVNVLGRYEGFPTSVPEPASLAILGLGVIGLIRRRKTQR
jgi:hypothetical protein